MKLVAAIVLVLSQVSLHSCRSRHSVSLVHDTSSELALVAPRKVPSLAQLIPILEGLDPPESKISKLKKLIPIYDELNKWRLNNKKRLVEILPFKKKVKPLAFILSGNDHYKLKNPRDKFYSDSDGHKTESHIDSDGNKIKEIRIYGHKHSGYPYSQSHRKKPHNALHNLHGLRNSHGSHKNSSHSSQNSPHSHETHENHKKSNHIALPHEEEINSIELHPKRKEIGQHVKEGSEDSSSDSNEYSVSHEYDSSESVSDSNESGSYSSESNSDSSIDSDATSDSIETNSGIHSLSYAVSSNEPVSSTKTQSSQVDSGTNLKYDYDSVFTEPFLESTQSYLHSDLSASESENYPGMSELRKSSLDLETSESDLTSDLAHSENESHLNYKSKHGNSDLHSRSSESRSTFNVESNESQSVTDELSREFESVSKSESKESNESESNVETNESESVRTVSRESRIVSNAESNVESNESESVINERSRESESVSIVESNESKTLINEVSKEFESVTNEISKESESVSNTESKESNESESNVETNESQSIINEVSRESGSVSNVESNESESVTNELSNEFKSVSNVQSNESESVTLEVSRESETVSNAESKESNVESNESESNVKSNESEYVTNEVSIESSSEPNLSNSGKNDSDSVLVSEKTESASNSESNQRVSEPNENFEKFTNTLVKKHHENDDSGENDVSVDQNKLVVPIENIAKEHYESNDTDHIAPSEVGIWEVNIDNENDFVPDDEELIVDTRYMGSKHQQNDNDKGLLTSKHTVENHLENVSIDTSLAAPRLMDTDDQDNNNYDAVELVNHHKSKEVIEDEQEIFNWRSTHNNHHENNENHVSGSAEDKVDNKNHEDGVSDEILGPNKRVANNYYDNYDDTGSGEETEVATNRHMINNHHESGNSSEDHENNYADENLAARLIHIIGGDELVAAKLITGSHVDNHEDQVLAEPSYMTENHHQNDVSDESDDENVFLVANNIKKYNRNHDVDESIVAKKHYKEDDGDQILVDIRHMALSHDDGESDDEKEYLVDTDTKKYMNDDVGESIVCSRTAENHEHHKNELLLSQHMAKNQHEKEKELVVATGPTKNHDDNDDFSASDDGDEFLVDTRPMVRKYVHDKADGVSDTLRNANLHRHRKHDINVNRKKAYKLSFIFNK